MQTGKTLKRMKENAQKEISLNSDWKLRSEPLCSGLDKAFELTHDPDGWISTPIPGDIHQGLIRAGKIKEPLLALNSFDCSWTENRSWWLRKTFNFLPEWEDIDLIELELNGLDSNAEIFLNGHHIGSHRNAFYPYIRDILPWLQEGVNTLLVRLTTGLETISAVDVASAADPRFVDRSEGEKSGHPERFDSRRTFIRKPQYTFGWDWNPRLATIAIAGDVKIRAMNSACIRDVHLKSIQDEGSTSVGVTVTLDKFHYYQTAQGSVIVSLIDSTGRVYQDQKEVLLKSGYNYVALTVPIENPRLWWPNGLGEQHLYQVQVELNIDNLVINYPTFDYGLKFIELDTKDKFSFIINNQKVFCKGANWVPADAIYARVSEEKYQSLIGEAQQANFNMLRVWGGGLYEPEVFYRACDRHGIMVWQDFMFACAPYPDHLTNFMDEVEREAEYQTRRLRNHACLVLWCGNNENHWAFRDWWDEKTNAGSKIYNYLLPKIVQLNCPEIPYWNSSPYGGKNPNCYKIGDCHTWADSAMNEDMQKRITPEVYDQIDARFISEYGYPGAPEKASVLVYMDGSCLDLESRVWHHHTNAFEKQTVISGIRKHYLENENPTLDEYLLYSGLCQGLMLGYSIDSARSNANCLGNLFWMYNDSWGEVGWTVIDYYLRRKPSWYFVRRANAPVRMILRPEGDDISLIIANDSREAISLELEYGYLSLDGNQADMQTIQVESRPLKRTLICVFPRGNHDPTLGLWVARPTHKSVLLPAIFRAVDFQVLKVTYPGLSATLIESSQQEHIFKINAQSYAHAVHLILPEGAIPSDNYFDLLPGDEREIIIWVPPSLTLETLETRSVNPLRSGMQKSF